MKLVKKLGFLKWFIGAAVFVLGIQYFDEILAFFRNLKGIVWPLVLGCIMAYVLNIIMSKLEKYYFPNKKDKWVKKTRRPVCMIASFVIIIGIVVILINVVLPELIGAIVLLGEGIPVYLDKALTWALQHSREIPMLEEWLKNLDFDWPKLVQDVTKYLTSGIEGILSSTMMIVGVVGKSLVNFFMGAIFAVYILFNKETLFSQLVRILEVFISRKGMEKVVHVAEVSNITFTKFITGQCTEAVILGGLCIVGMLIFRFPYAAMVGSLVGATALVPIVGAYIGAAVGAFMIMTVSPVQALAFLVFLVILQQLEGNLIYPKVVGASIGLPGMWVLAAVTIGGGLAGITGMLIGVPLAATFYKLFSEYIRHREAEQEAERKAEQKAEREARLEEERIRRNARKANRK